MKLSGETILEHMRLNKYGKSDDYLWIDPFIGERLVDEKTNLSYGITGAGYDVTLDKIRPPDLKLGAEVTSFITNIILSGDTERLFSQEVRNHVNACKQLMWKKETVTQFWLLPGKCCHGSIKEYLQIPTNMDVTLLDKSSMARHLVVVQNTIAEPGWYGYLTVEITNHSHYPCLLEQGMPIGQIQFAQIDRRCKAYDGKYQGQPAYPVPAK